jgi:hypothetical protein
MQIALFVSSGDALQPGWLLTFLKSVGPAHIKEMQQNLAKVCDCKVDCCTANCISLMIELGTSISRSAF